MRLQRPSLQPAHTHESRRRSGLVVILVAIVLVVALIAYLTIAEDVNVSVARTLVRNLLRALF